MNEGPTAVRPGTGTRQDANADVQAVVMRWLREDIGRPSPDLGRQGPICPLVPPALDAGTVRLRIRRDLDGTDLEELRAVLLDDITGFHEEVPPPGRFTRSLASLLTVLPDVGPTGCAALDQAHAALKDIAVQLGLMIGQFHPACDERAIRNPAFRVSRAPIPLLAIRHMAPHDVLFLHERPEWFTAYQQRFAAHFDSGRISDPLLHQLYNAAVSDAADEPVTARRRCRVRPAGSAGDPSAVRPGHRGAGHAAP